LKEESFSSPKVVWLILVSPAQLIPTVWVPHSLAKTRQLRQLRADACLRRELFLTTASFFSSSSFDSSLPEI
jgi:hypothetical protein